jgi:hypothetical protein
MATQPCIAEEETGERNTCGVKTLRIGERLSYEGRTYVLRGLQPMSVPDRKAEIADLQTGDCLWVAVELLTEPAADRPIGEPPERLES